ncbi:phosphoglycerate mutase [Candidatus Hydrogenisulfobacillus filiaventi]|uniref:2,3-bisphosphoglycerate-independent phosphoglycerate mutase n=1 Tax=Candidatus Hydrogenisulfobacillus filiaventi TaxID=2707344 RepID=A0A6F8ZJW5_9FIRM|nr:phosphoglycerate mutase [Candidatus Hydrogenisulfobacillus filiaventi]
MARRPVLLVIFDGFGLNPNRAYNGWALARTPHLDHYFASWPHTVLAASGEAVGLPDGQFGNSEVGHLTLGAGRVLLQDLLRISRALADGSFDRNPHWLALLRGPRLHLAGLVSTGGVHSHLDHLLALLPKVVAAGVEPVVHAFTDGRDTAPRAALDFLSRVEAALAAAGRGRIATVAGRYYAMDRAGHYERTRQAWEALVRGRGATAPTTAEAVRQGYARGEGDEFLTPTVVGDPVAARIAPGEPVLFFNFRSDRMRQLAAAVGLADFSGFDRGGEGPRPVTCMTEYDARFPFPVLFPPEVPEAVLAQVLAEAGLRQFHCAETEKYPHVTYFFNGGREAPFSGEDRVIVPSPAVATYDLAPEMSAAAVADQVRGALVAGYDFVLVNFANGDMVGHTGKPAAIIRAVETLDLQFHRVAETALQHGYRVLLTADHGNCDEMVDPVRGEPHTRHTPYPVPLLLMGESRVRLGTGRGLADVAPTVLDLMGLPVPAAMSGRSLVIRG